MTTPDNAPSVRVKRKLAVVSQPSGAAKSESGTAKRQKSGSTADDALHQKNPLYWPLEEFVVVEMENAQFKIPKFRLMEQSAKFASIFRGEEADGILLEGEVLDRGLRFANTPVQFEFHGAILRAAHALEFMEVRTWVAHRLKSHWSDLMPDDESYAKEFYHAVDTIFLARQCSLPQIVKRACYELLRQSSFTNRIEVQGGKLSGGDHETGKLVLASDVIDLVGAREMFTNEWLDICMSLPATTCPFVPASPARRGSSRTTSCEVNEGGPKWREYIHGTGQSKAFIHDPIRGLHELCKLELVESRILGIICTSCAEQIKVSWQSQRKDLWHSFHHWLITGQLSPIFNIEIRSLVD